LNVFERLREKERAFESRAASREAGKLAALRRERIRLEGQRKVYDLKAKEESRVREARASVRQSRFENSTLGKVAGAIKKNKSKKKGGGKPLSNFGGDSPFRLR